MLPRIVAAAVAVAALTLTSACSGVDPETDPFFGGTPAPAPVAGGPADTACFAHTWAADGLHLAVQIEGWMERTGGRTSRTPTARAARRWPSTRAAR